MEWRVCENNSMFSDYKLQTGYRMFTTFNEQLQDFAVKNYITNCGIINCQPITKEEYESNTQI